MRDLDELEAFDAMRKFLEAYWERGGRRSNDLAVLLGSVHRDVAGNARPWTLRSGWIGDTPSIKSERSDNEP